MSQRLDFEFFLPRHVDCRSVLTPWFDTVDVQDVQHDKLTTVVGRTQFTILATVDVRPTTFK